MKKTLTLTTALALVLIAGHASAQETTYAAGTMTGSILDVEGDDPLNSFKLDGDIEFTHNQLLFGGGAKHQSREQGGNETVVTTYEGFVGYMPNAELMVGLGVTGFAVNDSDSYTGYEGFVQYDNGQFGAALVYEMPLGQDEDLSITSLFGRAALTPEVTIGGVVESFAEMEQANLYLSADYDAGPVFVRGYYHAVTEEDAAIYGARGRYDFDQGFLATAELQVLDGFFGDDTTLYAIGGGYRISDAAMIDASVGQLNSDDNTANTFRIGLTFETGGRKRLDTTMTDAVRADFANGFGLVAPDFGFGSGFNF